MDSGFREEINEDARQAANKNSMVPCNNCNRTFLPDRLPIHLRSCRPSRPGTRTLSRSSLSTTSINGPPEPKKFNVSCCDTLVLFCRYVVVMFIKEKIYLEFLVIVLHLILINNKVKSYSKTFYCILGVSCKPKFGKKIEKLSYILDELTAL